MNVFVVIFNDSIMYSSCFLVCMFLQEFQEFHSIIMSSHESYSMSAIIFLFSFIVGGLLPPRYLDCFREYFSCIYCPLPEEFLFVPIYRGDCIASVTTRPNQVYKQKLALDSDNHFHYCEGVVLTRNIIQRVLLCLQGI